MVDGDISFSGETVQFDGFGNAVGSCGLFSGDGTTTRELLGRAGLDRLRRRRGTPRPQTAGVGGVNTSAWSPPGSGAHDVEAVLDAARSLAGDAIVAGAGR